MIQDDLVNDVSPLLLIIGETPLDFEQGSSEDLLSKMIQALKLEKGEVIRLFLKSDQENQLELISTDILHTRPRAIISLGAKSTNLILGTKERLSKVHGKGFPIEVTSDKEVFQTTSFPIFHPDILSINPNMKRSAWMDLQNVLEYLNKKV